MSKYVSICKKGMGCLNLGIMFMLLIFVFFELSLVFGVNGYIIIICLMNVFLKFFLNSSKVI